LVALDRLGIGLVVAADVVDQPARKHVLQLVGDVFAGLVTLPVFGYPLDEDLVDALVGVGEGVAGLLHQLLFESEVREECSPPARR
jgi:hypothetical protein